MPPAEAGSTPAIWFIRWREWEHAKHKRASRLRVEARGLANASADEQAAYNAMMIELKAPDNDSNA